MIKLTRHYPEYKNSGQPWVEKIPAHWDLLRNGRLFSQRNETGYGDLPILEVSLKTGVRVRDMDNGKRKQMMSDREKYKRAAQGDIAYNMMRMWQGAVGVAPVDGLVSPAYAVVRPFPEVDCRYFTYLFRTTPYMNEVDGYSRGIVKDRNRLYWQDFKRMPSVVPPIAEQKQIARFLDSVGSKIQQFIRTKRRLIGLLKEQKQNIINQAVTRGLNPNVKMKPTYLEWIGDIPDHWEAKPLKHLAKINWRVLPELTEDGYAFKYLDIGSVGTGRLVNEPEMLLFGAAPSRARRIISKGDTLISTVRTYLKAVYYVAENVDDWIASTGFAVLTPRQEIHPPFLGLLIQSDNFINRVIRESIGVAYPAIAETKLGTLHLAYPKSIKEQQKILDFIAEASKAIDRTITRAEGEIELMREYRTRLIADAVTGKLDVRGIEVPEIPDKEPLIFEEETTDTEDMVNDEVGMDEND